MKKIFLLFAAVTLMYSAQAQELGVRWGDVAGNDIAIDGLISLGDYSRVHANVSFGDGVGVDAIWDFMYKPLGDAPLNWYAGVGPSAFIHSDYFGLGASGELGLSYNFDFPMSISADWRPTFWILEDTDFRADGFGINVRYVFGQ